MNWASRLGGAGSRRWKIPWQREDWGGKMETEWEGEVAHGTHVWEREEKLAVKAKGQTTWSQKGNRSRYSDFNGGNCLSQPKLGLSSCHELHVSLPFTGAFNSQTLHSMFAAVSLLILCSPLPQQSKNKVWKVCFFTADYMMNCWRQPDSLGTADRTKIPSSTPRAKLNSGQVKGKWGHCCLSHSGWEGLEGLVSVPCRQVILAQKPPNAIPNNWFPCQQSQCRMLLIWNAPLAVTDMSWKRQVKHPEDRGTPRSVANKTLFERARNS